MNSDSQRSRDAFILITSLLILLIGTIIGWARNYLLGPSNRVLFGLARWYLLFDVGHALTVLVAVCALLVVGIRLLRGRPGLPLGWVPILHHRWVLSGSVAMLLAAALGNGLASNSRFAPALSVLTAAAGTLALLHSVYGRPRIDVPGALLTIAWLVSGLIAVNTLRALVAPDLRYIDVYRLKPALDAAYTRPARLISGALLLVWIGGPLLLAAWPAPGRALLRRIERWPGRIPGLLPVVTGLFQIVLWAAGSPEPLRLVNRWLVIGTLPSAALLAYRPGDGDAHPVPEWSVRTMQIARWMLLGLFSVALIPVAIGNLDYYGGDALAYMQIARAYATGQSAVRGLWSPLVSWVMAPAFWLNMNPLVLQRALVVILGLIYVALIFRLARLFDLPMAFQWVMAAAAALFVLRYAFWPPGPDFIATVLLLAIFLLILDDGWRQRPVAYGLLIGVLGSVSYVTRAFNLPFLLVHLGLTAALFALLDRKQARPILITAGLAALVMVIISAPWVTLLSARYGQFTIGLGGASTNAIVHNDYHQFCYYDGLCDQPEDVLFAWEDPDPAQYLSLAVSPLASFEALADQIEMEFVNARLWISTIDHTLGLLPLLGLAGIALLLLVDWADVARRRNYLWMLATLALYNVGYWIHIASEFRYFYPLVALLLVGVFLSTTRLAAAWKVPGRWAPMLGAVLIIAPLALQVFRVVRYAPPPKLFAAPDRCLTTDVAGIAPLLTPPLAGDGYFINTLSYATQIRAYGALNPEIGAEAIHDELTRRGVQTYVVFADEEELVDTLINAYGYEPVSASFCGSSLMILSVPQP